MKYFWKEADIFLAHLAKQTRSIRRRNLMKVYSREQLLESTFYHQYDNREEI